jgi:hypothetical protein
MELGSFLDTTGKGSLLYFLLANQVPYSSWEL